MNNWEQGRRKPDPAARLLLKVIEETPEAVEKAARAA
jgi:putative transcriptional regulator